MKRRSVVLLLSIMLIGCLSGCDADKVNNAINAVGDAAGVDTSNIKVNQDDLDKLDKVVNDAIETGKKVIEDEEVRDSLSGVADAIKDATTSIDSGDAE